MNTKLDFAFDCYDADENGSLTSVEVRAVIHGMLDLLVISKRKILRTNNFGNLKHFSLSVLKKLIMKYLKIFSLIFI